MGMHEVDIDEGTFRASPQAQQPKVDPGVVGYDTKPQGPVPRLISDNWGMWVQGNKLFFFDNQVAATPVYTGKRVVGFSPVLGIGGPYALLETEPMENPAGAATEVWANGSASLFALVGRHGQAAPRRDRDILPQGDREHSRVVERRSRRPFPQDQLCWVPGSFLPKRPEPT